MRLVRPASRWPLYALPLGLGLHVVFSDAFSEEKRRTMLAFGATVDDVPSHNGAITEALTKQMIARAAEVFQEPGMWWCDQLNNQDAITGYLPMGEEIWAQTKGQIDAFVHAVGTAHSIHGVTRALRAHTPGISVFAVEPAESADLSGKATGTNRIGFVPPLWESENVDCIFTVSADEAMDMARRLAQQETWPSRRCSNPGASAPLP